ncbi:centrosomal protein of 126 kDa [Anableps anableps]
MQALQGNFSYLLKSRLGSNGNLETERQHLAQQQKLCKVRARKFLLETNRRRKALEEQKKQRDTEEQRLRENILQQRRQQILEATQRFQRAHLPLSQRYRQTVRRNATNIEDALNEIQGSLCWYTPNSSELSTTNTRCCPPSTKPPTVSKSSLRQALSAVEAYTKLLQEQCTMEELQHLSPEDCDLLTLFTPPNEDSKHFEEKCLVNSYSHNILETNAVGAVYTKVDALYPREDTLLDFRSQMIHDDSQLTSYQLSAKNIPFSSENGILFETQKKINTTNNHLNDKLLLHTEKENFHLLSEKETCASINNLNKVSSLLYQTETPINPASRSPTSLSNIHSEIEKSDCPKEEDKGIPVSVACDVRFLKGILKKQSKYNSEDSCLCFDSGRLSLAKQVALAIRDSIELTRAKKDVVVNNGTKKKLRWFDEVHPEKESKEQNTMKQDRDMFYSLSHPTNSKDHHPSLTTETCSSKPGPRMTPAAFAGYHFTKEAWTDVGVQVNLTQERADEVKALHNSARTGGPRVPQRDCHARAGGGPVSSRTRKGTVIRPQSATEVSQIAKTPGKIMVPRPPPRTGPEDNTARIISTPCTHHPSINYKQPLVTQDADSTPIYTMTPVSYPCPVCPFSDSNLRVTPSSGHQETHNRGRGKMNEKDLCLHSTPTDEEISQLWHGVRSALNTKDDKPVLKKQALESRQVCRKPCTEQSRQPPGSGSRKLLQSSQVNLCTGCESAARLHMAEVPLDGLLKAQTQRPERVQERLTTLSLEEKKIMLSLDRLNHQLFCLKEHHGGRTDNNGHLIIGTPLTKEVKVSNNHTYRASSANQFHYQKKI